MKEMNKIYAILEILKWCLHRNQKEVIPQECKQIIWYNHKALKDWILLPRVTLKEKQLETLVLVEQ